MIILYINININSVFRVNFFFATVFRPKSESGSLFFPQAITVGETLVRECLFVFQGRHA